MMERQGLAEGRELLISFNFEDVHLAEALRASLFVLQPDRQIVLSPASYGAVLFRQNIAKGVYEADEFLLLIGPKGISSWQEIELGFALERSERESDFSVVAALVGKSRVPYDLGPIKLNWIELPVVTDRTMLNRLLGELQKGAEFAANPRHDGTWAKAPGNH
jgi:hypothetical protein